jgi:hypothetical protein
MVMQEPSAKLVFALKFPQPGLYPIDIGLPDTVVPVMLYIAVKRSPEMFGAVV